MKSLVGTTLGRYEILEKIGQGGMAHVYKAYQPGLNRFVAIKVVLPSLAEEVDFAERFQREAQAVARLNHPNILQVYDFGTHDSYNYLVMRYVENSTTLGDLIKTAAPVEKLIDYVLQVADALNYAHEHGIVHRDVKPGNILIDGKWALLSDFGLVKIKEASSQLTGTGIGIGTPAFMSPEQVSGQDVDHRTDIYALGVILHRILTGTIPHDAPTPLSIMIKRKTEPVVPPRQIKPDLPPSLEQVILRSLAPVPDDRYATATDFIAAIKKAEADPNYREAVITLPPGAGSDVTMVASSSQGRLVPDNRAAAPAKNKSLLLGGAITAVILLAVLSLALFLLMPDKPEAAAQTITETPFSPATATPVAATATPVPATATSTPTPSLVSPGTPAVVAQAEVEVRTGPGPEYDLLGYLPAGATAEIRGRDKAGDWWQIKTTLATTGLGWIRGEANLITTNTNENVPIALAPALPAPTLTPTLKPATPTATATSIAAIPTATATATQSRPTATPTTTEAVVVFPTATPLPAVPAGQLTLLKPVSLDEPSYGVTEFQWQWGGSLQPDQGFEVRVWREGEPPAGVHNAVEDNLNGNIVALGNNTYRLVVNIRDAYGVKGRSGEYQWTVVLIQISPEYKDTGIQAPAGSLRFEAGGGGGGGGRDGGGGGGDGGSI